MVLNKPKAGMSKKKSFFDRFSFSKQKNRSTRVVEQKHDSTNTKEPADSELHDAEWRIGDGLKSEALIQSSMLHKLDGSSCFMPNMALSDLPNTDSYQLAISATKENLKALIAVEGADGPGVNSRKLEIADMYKGLGMMQEAMGLITEVIASYTRSSSDPVLLSSALNDLALVHSALQDHKTAETYFHSSVEILSQTVEADQAVVWGNIAITLRNSKNYSEAIPMHELAVKMMDTILGKNSPETLFQRAQFAVTLKQTGNRSDRSRGKEMLSESIACLNKLGYGKSHAWIKDLR